MSLGGRSDDATSIPNDGEKGTGDLEILRAQIQIAQERGLLSPHDLPSLLRAISGSAVYDTSLESISEETWGSLGTSREQIEDLLMQGHLRRSGEILTEARSRGWFTYQKWQEFCEHLIRSCSSEHTPTGEHYQYDDLREQSIKQIGATGEELQELLRMGVSVSRDIPREVAQIILGEDRQIDTPSTTSGDAPWLER